MPAGRPREFCMDTALDQAMELFWKHGYDGTTLPALTKAMGINRPSLYAAFGNKKKLYEKALARYASGPAAYVATALSAPTIRDVAEQLLYGSLNVICNPRGPKGCLAVQSALVSGDDHHAQHEAAKLRRSAETMLRDRFVLAKENGELDRHADPADLAKYLAVIMHGMAVHAASGATRESLERVVAIALAALPIP